MRARHTGPPRGRQREADLNDEKLLRAARRVFVEHGWDAPVSVIAREAGIGMGSLYRRFASKEELVRRIELWCLDLKATAAEEALRLADPWQALLAYVRGVLLSRDHGGLLPRVGGRVASDPELAAAAERLRVALEALVLRAREAGVLRPDVEPADIPLMLEFLKARLPTSPERVEQLHLRYLDLFLDGLRAPAAHRPLPGPAPDWPELTTMWNRPPDPPGPADAL